MKLAVLVPLVAMMTSGLLGAQSTSSAPQSSGVIVISGRVENQSLMSLTTSRIDIELNQTRPAKPLEFQCIVVSRAWWTMLIQSTNLGCVVHQSNPQLKMLYTLAIPAFQSEPVNLNQPWESPLKPPTLKEGILLGIEIIFDPASDFLPEGMYTDQLVLSLARH